MHENSGMRRPVPTAAKSSERARSASKSQIATVTALRLKDGRALCVRRWPGGDDHTLVLLHGLLDSSEGWAALCERVDCTRIAFDLPGFGHSDPASPGSIAGYASDIAEGLAMLGVGRFALVDHSPGGAVATELFKGPSLDGWPYPAAVGEVYCAGSGRSRDGRVSAVVPVAIATGRPPWVTSVVAIVRRLPR